MTTALALDYGPLESLGSTALGFTTEVSVQTADDYRFAVEEVKQIKRMLTDTEDALKKITAPIRAAEAAARQQARPIIEQLTGLRVARDRALVDYDERERRKAAAEQQLQQLAAARERERLNRLAAANEAKGKSDTAQVQREQAAMVMMMPAVVPDVPKISGLSMREYWKFQVTDESLVPRDFLMVDAERLRKWAAMWHDGKSVPGVRFYSEKGQRCDERPPAP